MATVPILLKVFNTFVMGNRTRRRIRRDLILYLELLGVYLTGGYELGYAWSEVYGALREQLEPTLLKLLELTDHSGLSVKLVALVRDFPEVRYRVWFGVLEELYREGASIKETLNSFTEVLRCEEERDVESFVRSLPLKLNMIILLCFLPPTLLLLFVPLLLSLDGQM